ncbi:hypothetical protein GCM10027610_101960 [Dactylosporangium cerinum]
MLEGVGQRLLHHPVDGEAQRRRQRARRAGDGEPHVEPRRPQRPGQFVEAVEPRRRAPVAQDAKQHPQLLHGVAAGSFDASEEVAFAFAVSVGAEQQPYATGLQGHQADVVGDDVVQFAGDAGALVGGRDRRPLRHPDRPLGLPAQQDAAAVGDAHENGADQALGDVLTGQGLQQRVGGEDGEDAGGPPARPGGLAADRVDQDQVRVELPGGQGVVVVGDGDAEHGRQCGQRGQRPDREPAAQEQEHARDEGTRGDQVRPVHVSGSGAGPPVGLDDPRPGDGDGEEGVEPRRPPACGCGGCGGHPPGRTMPAS